MPYWHISRDIWGWRGTALVMAALGLAGAAALRLDPAGRSLARAATASEVIVFTVVLAAAALIYLHWRFSGTEIAGWLTISLLVIGGPNLTWGVLALSDPVAQPHPLTALVVDIAVAGTLLAIVLDADWAVLRVDPLAVGFVLGCTLSVLAAVLASKPPPEVPTWTLLAAGTVPVLVAVGIAHHVMGQRTMPAWGRIRLSLAVVLLALAQFAGLASRSDPISLTLELFSLIAGAGLLCCTSLALVRLTIHEHHKRLDALRDRLTRAEATVRDDRARLHEIGATVAGIASATRLIHHPPVQLPARRKLLLEELMTDEIERLQRLMLGEPTGNLVFGLDETLRRLVLRQQAQGHGVRWEPSGHRVTGCPDDVAEIVSILLDNAAKHGQLAPASLEVREVDSVVEIVVSDSGPGVAAAIQGRLFDWETRGPDSHGQGIGLNIARDLVEKQGGYLMLEDSPGPGATFVVGLLSGERHDAVGHIAG